MTTGKGPLEYNTSPVKFAVLTFAVAWVSWGIILVSNQFGYLAYGTAPMMLFYAIGGLSPAIVAITLLLRSRQSTVKALFKRVFDFKQPPILYFIVICVAALMKIVPLLLGKAVQTAPFYMAILLIPYDMVGGGLEEVGWRFIFQPRLEKRMPVVLAGLLTSLVWALWHLPLFWMEGTHQHNYSFLVFTIWVIGLAFFLAALYRVSKSVWLCILFHTLTNAIGEVIQIDMEIGVVLASTAILLVLSFLLAKLFRHSHLPAKESNGRLSK